MNPQPLPSNWLAVTLTDIAEIRDDLREPVNAEARATRPGQFPYYGATGQVGWIDEFKMDGEYVLLGEDGAPFFDRTKPKAYMVNGKVWVNNHAHVLLGKCNLCLNKYLLHALNSVDYHGYANGTTRLKLTQAAMRILPINLAPYPEQRRIVAKIEQLFSHLDAAEESLKRIREKLKQYRAAVLKAAVEGTLTERWRADHPNAEPANKLLERILTTRRQKWEAAQQAKFEKAGKPPPKGWRDRYEEPSALSDISNLPKLPKGWCWVSIDHVADVGTGATPRKSESKYYAGGEIPWVTSSAVNDSYVTSAEEKVTEAALRDTNLTLYQPGTLLLAMYGEGKTRGKVTELKIAATTNQALAAIQVSSPELVHTEYLKLLLTENYEKTRFLSSGGVQPNINLSIVRSIAVPLPPLLEQTAVIAAADRVLSLVDSLDQAIINSLMESSGLRQSTLKRAFEGKLVPQDPADEPAEKLLERIRADRAIPAPGGPTRGRPVKSLTPATIEKGA